MPPGVFRLASDVALSGRDEIGQLGHAFDAMAGMATILDFAKPVRLTRLRKLAGMIWRAVGIWEITYWKRL